MSDLLVKLYQLPPQWPELERLAEKGVEIRRVLPPEKHLVARWIGANFSAAWVSEFEVAMSHQPPGAFIAVRQGRCVGFACYDATSRGFFGPEGVDASLRGQGIGKALLLACLHDMKAQGFAYAVIGWAGPVDFYRRTVGATIIEDSQPGIYSGLLHESD
jgi:ribosomal protein S18 acetylase RimI-like enzyme